MDTDEIPGNAGLKDVVMALEWVKNNIAAFGGDSARVAAFGWSTGASAVHILSLLPGTRGYLSQQKKPAALYTRFERQYRTTA